MLEVYDRVLPSRSVPTLIGLSILTAVLFTFQAMLEITRGRMLVRIGNQLDCRLGDRARPPRGTTAAADARPGRRAELMRDLDTIRSVFSGLVRPHYSTCHGCRSTSPSALRFTR